MSYGLAIGQPPSATPQEKEKARRYDEWLKGRRTFGPRPVTVQEKAEAWDKLQGVNRGGWRT